MTIAEACAPAIVTSPGGSVAIFAVDLGPQPTAEENIAPAPIPLSADDAQVIFARVANGLSLKERALVHLMRG